MIELAVQFLLPSGATRALRGLLDTGASDNFLHHKIANEFSITVEPFPDVAPIQLGSEGATVDALGTTTPLTMQIGPLCKHRSNYTVLDLGDYDVILGRPFQKYSKARIMDDDCSIPTRRGYQTLPQWASKPESNIRLTRLSRTDMNLELRNLKTAQQAFTIWPHDIIKLFSVHQPRGQPRIRARSRNI